MSAIGVFLGRQRLAHFKINRKHRGKCLALICVDFSLRSDDELSPFPYKFKGRLSPFVAAANQGSIIRRGWLHPIPKWRSYPRTTARQPTLLENKIKRSRRGTKAIYSFLLWLTCNEHSTSPFDTSLSSQVRQYCFIRLLHIRSTKNKIKSRSNELLGRNRTKCIESGFCSFSCKDF